MISSFLLIGQSNMAGRGFAHEVPAIINEGIQMLRNGRWQMMTEPIHNDRPGSGIGLASSFAAAWRLDHPNHRIGLIPAAEGGTSLDDWTVGSALFDHAIAQAKLAQRSSTIQGILWHQGENDCFPERAQVYQQKLTVIMDALRSELGLPTTPLVIGALGDFLPHGMYGQYFNTYPLVNDALKTYAQNQPDCYYVSAQGLSANPDGLHFNAESLRVLGIRYYQAYSQRTDVLAPLPHENELLTTIYNRPLTKREQIFQLESHFATGKISVEAFQKEMASFQ
ncbi:sialate O-acetylesterase [Chitinophaga silvisoli]|uniref:Sialate O-acetylesterase n=1 Tax=Chitinophaga silvisoli TaxID=2291814 RepID=A0A3E1NS64_9BACT|nr:sialate O-acetylesterase [Chitinophaga silvisoli]RFM30757.1 sialate O-acetylesterase [Chitinophaga silvisoli]